MVEVILWVIIGSIFIGATKGALQGLNKRPADHPAVWVAMAGLYGATLLYFAPWEEDLIDPAAAEQRAANEQGARTLREGMSACDQRVLANATVPNSVDFHELSTSRNMEGQVAHIVRKFSAQNAYGTEIEHTYRCQYRGGQIVAFSITK